VAVLIGAAVLGSFVTLPNGSSLYDSVSGEMVLLTGFGDAAVIPIAWLFMRSDEKKRGGRKDYTLKRNKMGIREIILISLFAIGIAQALNFLIALIPYEDAAYEETSEEMFYQTGLLLQFIVIGVIGPISEELVFRGLIFRRVRDYGGFWPAAILSGLVFGIYHWNITQGIFASIMGVLFAMIYEHYGTIWASIAAHIANNIVATMMNSVIDKLDLPVSAYFIFLVVSFIVAVICGVIIFRKEDKVNKI
jgi:membrane protease YdiL (CAAX protease family)